MDLQLTPDEAEFRAWVQGWFREHLVGEFAENRGVGDSTGAENWDLQLAWERKLRERGSVSISWPREYGGGGGTLNQEIIFLLEFARVRAPYWVGVHGRDLFGPTLLRYGTPEQKQRFLPPIARAEEFWGQGFSEPDAGSDLASLRTRAERDGNEWVVNGQKMWMSLGTHADWLYVLCRTDPDAPKHRGISMLIIPAHQPGVTIRPVRNLAGGEEFCEVFFDDARTDADLLVGDLNNGWRVAMGTLPQERLLTTLPAQLGFEYEFDDLLAAVRGRGMASDPIVRQRLSGAWVTLQVHGYLTTRALRALMRGDELGEQTSLSKLSWATWHRDFGELAVDLLGPDATIVGDGYTLNRQQKTFLQSRAETIYGGANEIQRNIVGERLLGLPREPERTG